MLHGTTCKPMWMLLRLNGQDCQNGMLLWNGSDGGVLASFFLGQVETCILGHALASIIVLGAKMEHGGF